MNTRYRIYLIFFLSIGIVFLLIGIVKGIEQHHLQDLLSFTNEQVRDFLNAYYHGFPKPWET
ncbi:MAG: hypothetical protein ACTSUF_10805 [Candidatus Heimdallarchaeaceae archaeon]